MENLPKAMDDRDGWKERVREIRAVSASGRLYIYIYIKYFLDFEKRFCPDEELRLKLIVHIYSLTNDKSFPSSSWVAISRVKISVGITIYA